MQPLAVSRRNCPREIWVSAHRNERIYENRAWQWFFRFFLFELRLFWCCFDPNTVFHAEIEESTLESKARILQVFLKKSTIFSRAKFFEVRKKLARDANLIYARRWPNPLPTAGGGSIAFCANDRSGSACALFLWLARSLLLAQNRSSQSKRIDDCLLKIPSFLFKFWKWFVNFQEHVFSFDHWKCYFWTN